MNSEPLIAVRHLAKHYGKLKAVEDVSFSVYKGDVFGFLGPNGAGKSTTIRTLLSLISPTSGDIRLFGQDLKQHRNAILRRIGCIVEKPDFYLYLSAQRNLEIFGRLSGADVSRRHLHQMLDFVGLRGRENDRVSGFSHGMKQRLGIAQTLLHQPDLIILDEPTTGLDPQGIIAIRELILQLRNELGKTVVLSSHILSEIELIASRMLIINKGRSVVEGSVAELLNEQDLLVWLSIDQADKALHILQQHLPQLHCTQPQPHILQINMADNAAIAHVNALLVAGDVAVWAIESKRKLEDYFLKLVSA